MRFPLLLFAFPRQAVRDAFLWAKGNVTVGLSMLACPGSTGSVSPEKDLAGISEHKLTMQFKSRVFLSFSFLSTFALGLQVRVHQLLNRK